MLERAEKPATRERCGAPSRTKAAKPTWRCSAELAKLRRDYAHLFGMKNFADFQLRRRMVENSATAARFLSDVQAAVQARELRDIDELRDAKARHSARRSRRRSSSAGTSGSTPSGCGASATASTRKPSGRYFPPQESLAFVMRIAERMLGIRYKPVAASLWHDDARAFAVSDAKSGKPLATLYVDLYPREGKYNHAAVWPLRSASTRNQRVPQAALVVNMDRKGLTLDQLETLLHEWPRAAQQPVGDPVYAAGRRERAVGFRRGAVADARGLGLRQAGAWSCSPRSARRASRCPTR